MLINSPMLNDVQDGAFCSIPLKTNLNALGAGMGVGSVARASARTRINPNTGLIEELWGDRSQLIDTTTGQNPTDADSWWSKINCSVDSAGGVIASGGLVQHYINRTGIVSAGAYIFSAKIKPGVLTWARLYSYTGNSYGGYIDIVNGVIGGTSWGGAVLNCSDSLDADGYRKVWMYFVPSASGNIQIFASEADADDFYSGDDETLIYIKEIMLETLPSNGALGPDLMDQEALTARVEGYTLVVGTVYKIVSRATLDFTTVGAADNTAGTYFICHTAAVLGSGDAASDVTAPAKGSLHGIAMLAGSTELVTNGTMETTDNWRATGTPVSQGQSSAQKYVGTYSWEFTVDGANEGIFTNPGTYPMSVSAGKLYKYEFYVYPPSTTVRIRIRSGDNSVDDLSRVVTGLTASTWNKVSGYYVAKTTGSDTFVLFSSGDETSGTWYIDNVSVRQVQTGWTRYGTNTMEIDEAEGSGGALKITYVDQSEGGDLTFRDSSDCSSDLTAWKTYLISFKAKVSSGASIAVRGNWNANPWTLQAEIMLTQTSLTQYSFVAKVNNVAFNLRFAYMGAGESVWIDDITIKEVPFEAALQPSDYINSATIPAQPAFEANGLHYSPGGTNLFLYSENQSNWSAFGRLKTSGLTLVADPADGTNGWPMIPTTESGEHYCLKTFTGTVLDNTSYCFSAFVKPGTPISGETDVFAGLQYGLKDGSYKHSTFNLSTGSLADVNTTLHGISGPYNGYYHIWSVVNFLSGVTTPYFRLEIYKNATTTSFIGDNATPSFWIFGAQLTATTFPLPYIPTNGAMVSTAAETIRWTLSDALKDIASTAVGGATAQGTLIFDLVMGSSSVTSDQGILAFRDTSNYSLVSVNSAPRLFSSDGTSTPNMGTTPLSYNVLTMGSLTWQSGGNFQLGYKPSGSAWSFGTATAFDGTFIIDTYLAIGNLATFPFHIKNIRFFNRALSTTEIQRMF